MKTYRNLDDVHAPIAPYTHQIELSGQERLLFLSGQVGITPEGSLPEDPIAQIETALDNLARNLAAAGMGVQDVVKITFYLTGEMDAGRRRAVTARWLRDHKPCMTLLYVAALAAPQYRVEIDAWASRGD